MKWYKHISDSLDDPHIDEIIEEFGDFGYLAFFGIIEIYAREFKVKDEWCLDVSLNYLRRKLHQKSVKKLSNFLQSHLINKKWLVKLDNDRAIINIPKFIDLIDETTQKKLRNYESKFRNSSGIVPKKCATDKEEDKDKDKEKKEKKKRVRGLTAIPDKLTITPDMQDWFKQQGFKNIEIVTATAEFVDYWKSTGKRKKDWIATWRNGMRKMNEWKTNETEHETSWRRT